MTRDLLLRFDANSCIGIGHAKRCIDIAKYIKSNSIIRVIICTSYSKAMSDFIKQNPVFDDVIFNKYDTEEEYIKCLSEQHPNSIIMIDKLYEYSFDFIQSILKTVKVVMFHNECSGMYASNVVIFPIAHLAQSTKESLDNMEFYSGFDYVLINNSVTSSKLHINSNKPYIAITTGGSDHKDMISSIVKWVDRCNLEVPIVALYGRYYKGKKMLLNYCNKSSVNAKLFNYDDLFGASLVVSAFGVTPYELIYKNIPVITFGHTKKTADGSDRLAKQTSANISLGLFNEITQDDFCYQIKEVWEKKILYTSFLKKRKYIDGNGIKRIADILFDMCSC